eukprot:jgi/Orpsp1_1/1175642/evm.model.c7180000054664.1
MKLFVLPVVIMLNVILCFHHTLLVAYPKLVTGLMNGLGDYDYQIPESDILEQVDVEEPAATEAETPVSTVAEPVEPVEPVPTVNDPTLPPKTIDTLPAKTPEAVLPNPSEVPVLPPKTIDTLPAKTPEADLPNPSEVPVLPPKTIDTLPVKTPEPITPPEQNQAASDADIDLSYFSCDKQDWKCKSEKADLCFKEASNCWG